jgi:pyruvate,orthophosphate dikinase
MTSTKRVYLFNEGDSSMRELLGGKGANLAEMTRAGLPVPPGFTITTATCNEYLKNNCQFPEGLWEEIQASLKAVEADQGKNFGDAKNPLLVSVRSGAKFSMPGMMETILNLGLNDDTINGLIAQSGNERFAYDSYRRFIGMFSSVVLDLEKDAFEEILQHKKNELGVKLDTELDTDALKAVVASFKQHVQAKLGKPFPQDPLEQLRYAIESVFKSWNIPRAIAYRNYNKIDHTLGTAVNVQTMVFGNMGNDSATGVAFTRNPSTGEKELYGEYLINAQGEDVVAGIRTPKKLAEMKIELPALYDEFAAIAQRLETHYRDVQDMEFTIEKGRLYMLQTRNGKRTIQAAVKIAVDLANEGVISQEEALTQVDANQLPQLLLPSFDPADKAEAKKQNRLLATGLNASPGAATGIAVFNPDEAEALSLKGEKVILVRIETCPDDIHGMIPAQGVLTTRGGNTSHAAVVARGMGKPCVAGCESASIDLKAETFTANGRTLKKGDILSIDGSTGEVFEGAIRTEDPKMSPEFTVLLDWADKTRKLGVRANADTPEDAEKAHELGARGIGLCRTEHMFMAQDRLPVVQQMILADTPEARKTALEKLLPMQHQDFKGIFKAMAGCPVTIRLLDPPLHEFLPNREELLEEVTRMRALKQTGKELEAKEALLNKVSELHESNPMMGFRGCRLGLIYPEITQMQVRAIFEAATDLQKDGIEVLPEIMVPLIGHVNELKTAREQLVSVAEEVMSRKNVRVNYLFGTMIEIPRAALTADEIAEYAEFFSFGTNDLTQMTFGYSRDDAEGKFLNKYLEQGILKDNPFETLDTQGVGQLVEIARDKGRQARPDIKLGICGEHGGEAKSVQFCHRAGLFYVSCSPFRVPVARLAAAQAVVMEQSTTADRSMATV